MNNGRDCEHGRQVGKCDTCDLIEVGAERDRYKAALVALSCHTDELRLTNWSGLANIIERALCSHLRQRIEEGRRICKDCGDDVGPGPEHVRALGQEGVRSDADGR